MIKEVAEEIGVHPSTVSRAVANKYVHTPQGVSNCLFLLRERAGPRRRRYIAADPETPRQEADRRGRSQPAVDDEQITRILQSQGIQVTRRTVAKIPGRHENSEYAPKKSEKVIAEVRGQIAEGKSAFASLLQSDSHL